MLAFSSPWGHAEVSELVLFLSCVSSPTIKATELQPFPFVTKSVCDFSSLLCCCLIARNTETGTEGRQGCLCDMAGTGLSRERVSFVQMLSVKSTEMKR